MKARSANKVPEGVQCFHKSRKSIFTLEITMFFFTAQNSTNHRLTTCVYISIHVIYNTHKRM